MPSLQLLVDPSRRAAARYVGLVRRAVQQAYAEVHERTGLTQSEIARKLGVHRSVISRQLRGKEDLTIGRLGELAWAMGLRPKFELEKVERSDGTNISYDLTTTQPIPKFTSRTSNSGNPATIVMEKSTASSTAREMESA
jgi:plasmid maintenance system antidote protein VapI